ncbi:MAG: hypothetical protein LBH25_08615 [Fibromonadaceae bacterium]|jgi:hypothetical protein|nr:hypothetical protein [Fibromonadaceae bacterium]
MRPQYFPWLFDDKNAWEKSLADSRYSYELPMDNFMGIYSVERKVGGNIGYALPSYVPSMSPITPQAAPASSVFTNVGTTAAPVAVVEVPKEQSKLEEGILSQDEIDALLSGL